MRGKHDPDWKDLVASWKQEQSDLRARMIVRPLTPLPRFVAGVDAAYSEDKGTVFAAAVVYDRDAAAIVDVAHATIDVDVPYIPGFLSFREGPAVRAALAALKHSFGVICFDGQGDARPRHARRAERRHREIALHRRVRRTGRGRGEFQPVDRRRRDDRRGPAH